MKIFGRTVPLVLLLLTQAASASAQANWKQEHIACTIKGKDIRCAYRVDLMVGTYGSPVGTIALCNKEPKNYTTTFKYTEYHSLCGAGSKAAAEAENLKVENGVCIGVPMMSNDTLITCIEGFITQCKKDGGAEVPCGDLLDMRLDLATGSEGDHG